MRQEAWRISKTSQELVGITPSGLLEELPARKQVYCIAILENPFSKIKSCFEVHKVRRERRVMGLTSLMDLDLMLMLYTQLLGTE